MKKFLFICAAVAATACCGGKQAKVSAIVAGPDKVAAVVVEYAEALDAESVCPEAFVVEGKEVVCAKVVDGNKVVVTLKKECCGKCEGEKKECCKEKAECGEAKPECCEEKKAECGEKHECAEKHECEGEKKECCKEKKAECCEIPVPDVAVKQVVDLKTAEGKTVKAWKKAVKATEACPACPKKPCCGEKPECGEKHECGEKPDCCKKAE